MVEPTDEEDEIGRIINTLDFIKTNIKSNNKFISDKEIRERIISLKKRIKQNKRNK